MKTEDLEKESKDGIDLDNPEHVDYLYKWAQHCEKKINRSIETIGRLVQDKEELKDTVDELVGASKKMYDQMQLKTATLLNTDEQIALYELKKMFDKHEG